MRAWWRQLFTDTLAKRLFLLMWGALVLSHLLAWATVRWVHLPSPPGESWVQQLPTLPSLPPTPGLPGPGRADESRPPPRPPLGAPAHHDLGPEAGTGALATAPADVRPLRPPHPPQRGLSLPALLLDYGLRLLVIGLAAWWGSRWLARPMRRLVDAADALGAQVMDGHAPTALDEQQGTQEVREAAQVFNRMARQLQQQIRARSLLMAAISHDLRTPLTRLRMRLETLDIDALARDRSIADLREMNAMVEQALALFRGQSHAEPPQSLSLAALLQAMADDLAEQGQTVDYEGPSEGAVVRLAPQALRRVLDNLIGNALRYGGQAHLRLLSSGDGHEIHVDDDGPGIAEAELEAVFDPFYRLESSRNRDTGGVGLGLYIARELSTALGAQLSLHRRTEGGLSARLRLPQSSVRKPT